VHESTAVLIKKLLASQHAASEAKLP